MSLAVTLPMASQSLSREAWVSLASLLRSHVAMRSIAQPGGALRILSNSDTAVEILGAYGRLSVLGPSETGQCAVEFRPEAGELGDEYSAFFFTEMGLVQFANLDDPIDIEAAVEHLLDRMGR